MDIVALKPFKVAELNPAAPQVQATQEDVDNEVIFEVTNDLGYRLAKRKQARIIEDVEEDDDGDEVEAEESKSDDEVKVSKPFFGGGK